MTATISGVNIRSATVADLPLLQDIERAAGEVFRQIGMPQIAEDEPPSLSELSRYQQDGRAWVAVNENDRPVAYLIAETVDGNLHIEQVSVHPDYAHRRIGRTLLERASQYAMTEGMSALTLTTFTQVPWNGPYYSRCGFLPIPETELGPGLLAIRDREIAQGLHRWPRICMRRDL